MSRPEDPWAQRERHEDLYGQAPDASGTPGGGWRRRPGVAMWLIAVLLIAALIAWLATGIFPV